MVVRWGEKWVKDRIITGERFDPGFLYTLGTTAKEFNVNIISNNSNAEYDSLKFDE